MSKLTDEQLDEWEALAKAGPTARWVLLAASTDAVPALIAALREARATIRRLQDERVKW